MNELEERAVLPFYLQMMGLNAVRIDPDLRNVDDLWPELIPTGRSIDLLDVKWLLGALRPSDTDPLSRATLLPRVDGRAILPRPGLRTAS